MSHLSTLCESLDVFTHCAHAGLGEGDGQPLTTPIVQSTTFCRGGVDSDCTHQYSRVSNPTVAALESALARLDDAAGAACFASGLAAETALFLALLKSGDHVVCGRSIYGGTTRLLREILTPLGVTTTFIDSSDLNQVERAIRPATKLIFIETPANPTLELTDIAGVSRLARRAGVLLAVDNTFLTPVLQRPLDLGADICVYSTTKFIDGHSAAIGGALVSRDDALLDRIRFVRKSTGAIQSPQSAWLTLQGLKTLPIRLVRQCETAEQIARWLAQHPNVDRVVHPALDSYPQRDLASAQHDGLHGAVIAFELKGGSPAARVVAEQVRLIRLVEHVGSVETLLTHPASMTHADVPPEQRAEVGVTDGLLRLSVGLEDPTAIQLDLARAFERAAQDTCRLEQEVDVTCAVA